MAGFTQSVINEINSAARAAVTDILRDARRELRDSINVPVQRVGSEVIRSDPGEPPRREFGDLWKSIQISVVQVSDTQIRGRLYSNDKTGKVLALEYGRLDGSLEPRPFFGPQQKRLAASLPAIRQRFRDKLRERGLRQFTADVSVGGAL